MAKKKDKDAIVTEIRDRWQLGQETESDNRISSLEDQKFENGEQWDHKVKAEREKDSRPCLTINKTAGVVKQIIGDFRQNDMSIKVRPVDDQADPEVAEIYTGLIRNIENISNSESAYDTALDCAVRGGYGYFRIITEYSSDDTFDQDIFIKRVVNPQSVTFGPAQEIDNSDAEWCIITEDVERETFKGQYPKATAISQVEQGHGEGESGWFTDETVRVAEYFKVQYRDKKLLLLSDGRTVEADKFNPELNPDLTIVRERTAQCRYVEWYKSNGSEILEGPTEIPSKYIPVVPVFGEEVWIEGKRILRSAIKWAKDPAKLYNWSRSNAAETLALAPKQPFLVTPAEIKGHEDQWKTADRKPMPYLLHNPSPMGRPARQPAAIPNTGAYQESLTSADDIKATTGLYDASLGAKGNETSGKAINARERQGDTATFVFIDNLKQAIQHAGRILVDMIPRVYDTERVVRLLSVDGTVAQAVINQKNPLGEKVHDLSQGKYDVVVDVGPAYTTKRLEAADAMTQMMQAAPQVAPIILPRIAKNQDWPEADEVAQELQMFNPAAQQGQQQQGPDPNAQLDLAKGQLDIQSKELDIAKKQQDIRAQGMDNMEQMAQQVTVMTLKQLGVIP